MHAKISEVESKIPATSRLVTTTVLDIKFSEVENKIPDHAKHITTQEFHMLTADNFVAGVNQAPLTRKTAFDEKSNKLK